jgi:MFS transporter, ACS family, allantoate permease
MYLLTGGLAIVVGIFVIIWMPDSPLHAVFLSQKERIIAVERIRDDQGGMENKIIKKHQVVEALMDVKSWLIVLLTVMSE